jgi:ubiquinone biosynthesis protein
VVLQIQRFSQIVEIMGRYGFGIVLAQLFPSLSRARFRLQGTSPGPSDTYERMLLAIEELGPTFVKFGQIMSTRADIFPPEMIAQLKKLQDQVPPVPFEEIRPVIEECCPCRGEWLLEIDETPVAAASIAQVHRAVLKDGTRVALKIQRPGIGELIETDLLILQSIAERVERVFPDTRVYNPTGIVKDFAHQIRKELDFLNEARTSERMKKNFRSVTGIHFPRVYWEYSSRRLLVMELVEGVRIDNLEEIAAMGLDPHEIGSRGFHAYLKMIFEDGFFHGDPHPGNLLVGKDGTIVVLDFGIAGVIRPEKRWNFINFLAALMNEDTELMTASMEALGVVIPDENRQRLQDEIFILIQDLGLGQTISRFHFAFFVTELSEVMRRERIQVPMNLMLLLKVLVMTLDIGLRLNPGFNLRDELSPYLLKIAHENTFSVTNAKRASVSLLETSDAVLDMPRYLAMTVRRLAAGMIRLDIIDTDIRAFQNALDSASDKLMIGFVVGSLVIGSSVVLKVAPFTLPPAVSWIAVLGYGAAMLVSFYVIYHSIFLAYRRVR